MQVILRTLIRSEKAKGVPTMVTLRDAGKRLLFWGALVLVLWAAYELYIRVDAMIRPLGMFFRMWIGEKVPINRAVTYIDWKILEIPGYLALCVLLGVYVLLGRKKIATWVIALVLSVALAVLSAGLSALLAPSLWQMLKLTPLVLIFLGALLRLIAHNSIKKRHKARGTVPGTEKNPVSYDPFNMQRPGWNHQEPDQKQK